VGVITAGEKEVKNRTEVGAGNRNTPSGGLKPGEGIALTRRDGLANTHFLLADS